MVVVSVLMVVMLMIVAVTVFTVFVMMVMVLMFVPVCAFFAFAIIIVVVMKLNFADKRFMKHCGEDNFAVDFVPRCSDNRCFAVVFSDKLNYRIEFFIG